MLYIVDNRANISLCIFALVIFLSKNDPTQNHNCHTLQQHFAPQAKDSLRVKSSGNISTFFTF